MTRQNTTSNIALIGFSATGKSAVAKKVAAYLNWDFVDTDDEIVKLGDKSIPEIFKQDGEDKFRQLECQTLKSLCQKEKIVISTGGGIVLDPGNQELLRETSTIICLEAKTETIYKRLLQDTLYSPSPTIRPLLAGDNPLDRIRQLKASRQLYYSIADWTIHTDNLTIEEASQEVIKGWRYANRYHEDEEQPAKTDLASEVETAAGHCPIFVGWNLLDDLGQKIKQTGILGVANIISDETVFSIHGSHVVKVLESSGFTVNSYLVPPGETTKTLNQADILYDFLIKHHVERNDMIIALGGGMVGDLAGFVAATFLRGLHWVQVPTSLVAMVDASIGGKVGVNHCKGKNLIGAFYQPNLVVSDIQTLTTLPPRELISGWAEVVKYGLILDSEFFELLEANTENLVQMSPDITSEVIARSASIKAQIVTEDEREMGKRIILNYGHTIAHGLEAATMFERFLHGEAVAIGMMGAAKLSQRLGLISQSVVERQKAILRKFNLPTDCSGVNKADVLNAMELDKKVRGRTIRWVLLEDIGRVVIRNDVPSEEVASVLEEVINF